jgi:hypothetical protein
VLLNKSVNVCWAPTELTDLFMDSVTLWKESNSQIGSALDCFHVNVVDIPPIRDERNIRPRVVLSWYSLMLEFGNW